LHAAEAGAHLRAISSHECATAISQPQAAKKAAAEEHDTREDRSKAAASVPKLKPQSMMPKSNSSSTMPPCVTLRQSGKAANDLDELKWVDLLDYVEPACDAVRGT
jgi:hypothetical protein